MNNLPERDFFGHAQPNEDAHSAQRLEDYLDHLCAPLVGIVPYKARHDFRTESRAHLEALMAEYQELGMTPHQALETAFREFGDPWKLGRAFLREWLRNAPARLRRRPTPTACAFAWFGAGTAISLVMFEWWACVVPSDYYDWAGIASGLHFWTVLMPLIAGLLTGLMQPYPDGKAVLRVQAVLLLFTLLLGVGLLPHIDVLNLAAYQLRWWLPAGYVTTVAVATMAQRLRRLRFWHAVTSWRPVL